MSTTQAIEMDLCEAEYHNHPAVSYSALKIFAQSPALYEGIFVSGRYPKPEPTAAMRFGSALHCAALEPDNFENRYLVGGPINPKTGKSFGPETKAFAEWVALNADGREVLSEAQEGKIACMVAALRAHPIAGPLLQAGGHCELPLLWSDEVTGMECRCKIDKLIPTSEFDCPLVIDLKTADSPGPDDWPKKAYSLLYHVQSAMYAEAAQAYVGKSPLFLFMVIGSEIPHDVWVYACGDTFIEHGREAARDLRNRLDVCIATNLWWAPNQTLINPVDAPGWAKKKESIQ